MTSHFGFRLFVLFTLSIGVAVPSQHAASEAEGVETEIQGTARLMHLVSKGGEAPELPNTLLVVRTERHGDVAVDLDGGLATVEHGATVALRGVLDERTNVLTLREVLAVGPVSEEVQEELERERTRRAAEAQRVQEWLGDAKAREAAVQEKLAILEDLAAAEKSIEPEEAEAAIAAALGGPPPPPPTTPLSMLILPSYCSTDPASLPATPTPADLEALVNNQVTPFFDEASAGVRTFTAVSTPWLDRCEFSFEMNAEQRASFAGYNPASYDRIAIVEPNLFGSFWGGLFLGLAEDIPGRRIYINLLTSLIGSPLMAPSVWAHELGHLEGLFHANALECIEAGGGVTYSLTATCTNAEYEDPADTMGNQTFTLFSPAQRDRKDWFFPGDLVTATGGFQQPVILPYSGPWAGPRAVKIPLASGTYYIERRVAFGADADLTGMNGLLDGVQIRVMGGQVDVGGFAESIQLNPQLLDGKPASVGDWSDAALPWNTTYVTPEGVKIKAEPVFFGVLARIKVSFPTSPTFPPSAPTNIVTNYDPVTNTANLSWDPPLVPGWGSPLFYVLEVNPSTGAGPIWTAGTSASISGLPDGLSSVSLRSLRLFVGASEPTYSTPLFVWAHPSAPNLSIGEGTFVSTVANVPLTMPWAAPAATSRDVVVRSGSATAGVDFTGGSGAVPYAPGDVTQNFTFYLNGDPIPEPNETAIVHVGRPICLSGTYIGTALFGNYPVECFLWEPVSTVTIVNDD